MSDSSDNKNPQEKDKNAGLDDTTKQDDNKNILPHSRDDSILESFRYINSMPGKNVRSKLIDCFQLWMNCQDQNNIVIKDIVGDLHNASLMIDDIEDNSKLRRGVPCAHAIYGIPTVINTANYVYFLALEKCHALNNPRATQVFTGELLNLHRGQGHDIAWRENVQCPTEQQYLQMVADKTGGLFRLAVGLMQAFATTNVDTDFTPLVNNLALYFQIRDDYINLADEEYMKSKSFCEDLSEGKFSFPMIHGILKSNAENDTRLLSILKQRTEDIEVKRYAQSLLYEFGSIEYTRQKCFQLKKEIMEQIQALGGNETLVQLVENLDLQFAGMHKEFLQVNSPQSKKLKGNFTNI